ncbi:Sulphatase-modifying factor protein OS=Marichromatium purpuratum 984 GN=MARPU_05865 PE=4 SV=1: FGE-sulfatase [Gemmata massiliana]|uniref:Sulfatase-modifying factor enzyme-like domain-containing protein n=2 Tax=Gemmata massiliana TaxID=1210884 RepID=A0A6P2CTJ6_9BACT|nr:Sulphatase-modifying factor protein OS=Marichromatium purpuratum 984 GN=MARPU_05865 PE=4 SV=1: FGE-sulfatase [Gemmata massiliana]
MGSNPSRFKGPRRPVERVSWEECQEFAERLNGHVALGSRLPTEAQWEYACRAGTTTSTYTGDVKTVGENNAPGLDAIAWYGGNSGWEYDLEEGEDSSEWPNKQYPHTKAGTRVVGQKRANGWGLYDMLGNVWEWCWDGMRPYTTASVVDPVGPMGISADRVIRGGGWHRDAQDVRAAYHFTYRSDHRAFDLGFRCLSSGK